jgi:chromosome segregation ATPase
MVTAPALWQPIGEIVAEFRNECGDFEHILQGLFDQLEHLRGELDHRHRQLEQEQQRVAERERQLAEQRQDNNRMTHQFEHQEARLSETLTELEELKTLVRRAVEDNAERDALAEAHLERQVDALQQQLAAAQTESTKHATMARDLAAARKELADLRAEFNQRGATQAIAPEAAELIAELQHERSALESELELVRGRAAELHDALAQERRALSEHRAETANELKQMRRMIEKQAELLSDRTVTVAAAHEAMNVTAAHEATEAAPPADPVISSVMAQFAKLQKEVAERRKQRK